MDILFLDAYYEPETIAYTHLEKDLINGLLAEGHTVHIICPIPTRGITREIREKYKKMKYESRYNGNVIVRRFWAPQEKKNPVARAIRYLWCNLRTYYQACKLEGIDMVFCNSTPPTQGALSGLVAKRLTKKYKKKVPFIYNLQDIFPDSLVHTKLTRKDSLLWKMGRMLENFTYRNADKIILISKGFKNNVLSKGVPEDKVEIISNWIDLDAVHPVERKDNRIISEFELNPKKYFVVYAGNFGSAQGADIILKVAKKFEEIEDVQFLIFGGGAYYEDAKKEAESLKNVFIHELMPQDRISEVYSLGDVALITCKKGTGKAGMPSKTWSIMACNTPIIASFDTDSDLADVIRDSGAGSCIEAEQIDLLFDAINLQRFQLKKDNNLRNYVEINASKTECVKRFIACINSVSKIVK